MQVASGGLQFNIMIFHHPCHEWQKLQITQVADIWKKPLGNSESSADMADKKGEIILSNIQVEVLHLVLDEDDVALQQLECGWSNIRNQGFLLEFAGDMMFVTWEFGPSFRWSGMLPLRSWSIWIWRRRKNDGRCQCFFLPIPVNIDIPLETVE